MDGRPDIQGCISMTQTTACDDYKSNFLSLPNFQRLAAASNFSATGVTSLNSFDTWINGTRTSNGWFYTTFLKFCSAVPPTIRVRYMTSMNCGYALSYASASKCSSNLANPPPAPCDSVCTAFSDSLISILQDPTYKCSFPPDFVSNYQKDQRALCGIYDLASSPDYPKASVCSSGSAFDRSSCGFGEDRMDLAKAYCNDPATQQDSCCSSLRNQDSASPPAITPTIIGAMAGAVLLLLVIAAVIIIIHYRRKNAKLKTKDRAADRSRLGAIEDLARDAMAANAVAELDLQRERERSAAASKATSSYRESFSLASDVQQAENLFQGTWVVHTEFVPSQLDEVALRVGDYVHLHTIYNDGWSKGVNKATGQEGYLPMACIKLAANSSVTGVSVTGPYDRPAPMSITPTVTESRWTSSVSGTLMSNRSHLDERAYDRMILTRNEFEPDRTQDFQNSTLPAYKAFSSPPR